MKIERTPFAGLLIIEPRVHEDGRGYFFESYNKKQWQEQGIMEEFVQDNQSFSRKGVLRGLHFQVPPQAKLVRTLAGAVQDVVVDLRRDQPTFGKSFSLELSAENKKQLLVPRGFAHGFLVLSDSAEIMYKIDEYYRPNSEGGILYNDPVMEIQWKLPAHQLILSDRDRQNPTFEQASRLF